MISPHRVGFKNNSIVISNSGSYLLKFRSLIKIWFIGNISQSEIEIPEENNNLPIDLRLRDYY